MCIRDRLVLAYSDDDGLTWSKPINITEQTKAKDWRILFTGTGNGICMKDGTLVFAAQYGDGKGVPWSTIVYSKDQGKTWHLSLIHIFFMTGLPSLSVQAMQPSRAAEPELMRWMMPSLAWPSSL